MTPLMDTTIATWFRLNDWHLLTTKWWSASASHHFLLFLYSWQEDVSFRLPINPSCIEFDRINQSAFHRLFIWYQEGLNHLLNIATERNLWCLKLFIDSFKVTAQKMTMTYLYHFLFIFFVSQGLIILVYEMKLYHK